MPGIKKLLPESFRKHQMFDNIYNLECVPIATVQVRFNGWVGIEFEFEFELGVGSGSGSGELTLTQTLTLTPTPTPP